MKVGSLVECISLGAWYDRELPSDPWKEIVGPEYGDICTVIGFGLQEVYPTIYLEEWPNEKGWGKYSFREIQPPMDIAEVIEEIQMKHEIL